MSLLLFNTRYSSIYGDVIPYMEVTMKIIIESTDKQELQVTLDNINENESFDDIFAMLIQTLDGYAKKWLDIIAEDREQEVLLGQYESFCALFEKFLSNVFPEVLPADFALGDAAILKATDDIVAEAEKRGITFDEALKEYREKAEAYVKEKKGVRPLS